MSETVKDPTRVVTGKVRFSYAHVFEPHSMNETDAKKYSLSILIPKKDKATLAKIDAAINAAKELGKSKKFGGKIPPKLKLPLRDGDEERPEDEAYAGMMFLNANSNKKPTVVDVDGIEILDREEFYSGCWGRASFNFYAFDFNGTKGIACGLGNIKKTEEGTRLGGGGASAEQDFGDDDLG